MYFHTYTNKNLHPNIHDAHVCTYSHAQKHKRDQICTETNTHMKTHSHKHLYIRTMMYTYTIRTHLYILINFQKILKWVWHTRPSTLRQSKVFWWNYVNVDMFSLYKVNNCQVGLLVEPLQLIRFRVRQKAESMVRWPASVINTTSTNVYFSYNNNTVIPTIQNVVHHLGNWNIQRASSAVQSNWLPINQSIWHKTLLVKADFFFSNLRW